MSCDAYNRELAGKLRELSDKQLLAYSDNFTGMEGRELARELARRLRVRRLGNIEDELHL